MTGVVGDLQRGIAEIGWGNLYITPEREEFIDFSDWYLVEPSCFLAQSPGLYRGIYTLLLPLEAYVWLCSFLSVCLILTFYTFYAKTRYHPLVNLDELVLFGIGAPVRECHKLAHKKLSPSLR